MNKNEFVGVIIDAGHGGDDPGATANNLLEKDLNLKAATYMYQRLQELGIPAKIIRDKDETLPKNERINRVLNAYNDSPNTILIANHINAGGGEGAEVVYALRNNNTLANMILDNIEEKGQIKRQAYQRRLPENPSKDYYYILRETSNTEPLLVEYGFIDNLNDVEKLKNNLEDYVEAVIEAIANYIGYEYYPPAVNSQFTYIVKRGDTLYSIADRYNITVDELKRINNLTTNTITIGQILNINTNNQNNNIYEVKRGDTLYSIANKYNTTVQELKTLNNLQTNTLSIGQNLLIPIKNSDTEPNEPNIPNYPPEEEIPIETEIYIVKKGDSLWLISKNNNITVDYLIKLNNLSTINIKVGDKLLIPKRERQTYIVKKGDTLWSISKNNNISVEELKRLNNLNSNLLSIGQELIIST